MLPLIEKSESDIKFMLDLKLKKKNVSSMSIINAEENEAKLQVLRETRGAIKWEIKKLTDAVG